MALSLCVRLRPYSLPPTLLMSCSHPLTAKPLPLSPPMRLCLATFLVVSSTGSLMRLRRLWQHRNRKTRSREQEPRTSPGAFHAPVRYLAMLVTLPPLGSPESSQVAGRSSDHETRFQTLGQAQSAHSDLTIYPTILMRPAQSGSPSHDWRIWNPPARGLIGRGTSSNTRTGRSCLCPASQ